MGHQSTLSTWGSQKPDINAPTWDFHRKDARSTSTHQTSCEAGSLTRLYSIALSSRRAPQRRGSLLFVAQTFLLVASPKTDHKVNPLIS